MSSGLGPWGQRGLRDRYSSAMNTSVPFLDRKGEQKSKGGADASSAEVPGDWTEGPGRG